MNESASGYVGYTQKPKFNRESVLNKIRECLPPVAYEDFSSAADSTLMTVDRLVKATKAHHCYDDKICEAEVRIILHRAYAGFLASKK
jgi:hypothetical protein